MDRIKANRDYLIIAPNEDSGSGYYHILSERGFLINNLQAFLDAHKDMRPYQVTIYELHEINQHKILEPMLKIP